MSYNKKYENVFTQDFMLKPENERLYYLDGVLMNGINNKQISNELSIKIMDEYLKNNKLSKKYTKYIKNIEDGGILKENLKLRSKSPISITEVPKEKKVRKEKNVMKARSDLEKKGDKYLIDTEMKVSKSLDKKAKRALKKSVENALKNELGDIKGKGGAFSSQITPEMEEIVKNEEFKRKFMPNKTIDKSPLTITQQDALDRRIRDRNMEEPRKEMKAQNKILGEKAKKQTDDFIKAEIKRKKKIDKEFEDAEHKRLLGKGVKKIILDLDSSDDEKPKRKRGRPKKST